MRVTSMRKTIWLSLLGALAVLAVLAAFPAGEVLAQGSGPTPEVDPRGITDDQVNAIAKQLYCPVCENIPLDVCPTQACVQWRELIRVMLAEGRSEQEIKDYFVNTYGDRVLATPPPNSFLNRIFPIVPWVLFAVAALVLYRAIIAWRRPVPDNEAVETPSPVGEDEYVRRLEDELKRR